MSGNESFLSQGRSRRLGGYATTTTAGELVRAYLPPPLPPEPPVQLGGLLRQLERANRALGRLDGVASILPDPALFIYMYVRKEALLSSQIEGTQSSLSDLLLFESEAAPGVPVQDVEEVSSYVAAMNHGLDRLRDFPLSLRLIREIHGILLAKGRGSAKQPGEFRRSQNWIGGTRPGNAVFVPPPPEAVLACLSELELFLHRTDTELPVLVKAGLAHVQFETIHPFLDGNGRLGRLLITFILCSENVLKEPLLYLSLFFKINRERYYELLQAVRLHGAWEEWLDFFLEGVAQTADQAADAARRILAQFEEDRRRIEGLGRAAASALRVHQALQKQPITSIAAAAQTIGVSAPTAAASLGHLMTLGIVRELTGRQRGRTFVYDHYLQILSEHTEPLPPPGQELRTRRHGQPRWAAIKGMRAQIPTSRRLRPWLRVHRRVFDSTKPTAVLVELLVDAGHLAVEGLDLRKPRRQARQPPLQALQPARVIHQHRQHAIELRVESARPGERRVVAFHDPRTLAVSLRRFDRHPPSPAIAKPLDPLQIARAGSFYGQPIKGGGR